MTETVCAVDACGNLAKTRGWCGKHYQRWCNRGSLDDPPVRPKQCALDGCERPVHGHGLCAAHWNRKHRYGDPLGTKARPVGRRVQLGVDLCHPLAGSSGKVRRARLVLFDALGGHGAPCHWCGRVLEWYSGKAALTAPDSLCADHLDGNTQNDVPANLVPACRGCNTARAFPSAGTTCSVQGCRRVAIARGWCTGHYRKWSITGEIPRPIPTAL